jgi:hypothetical protein
MRVGAGRVSGWGKGAGSRGCGAPPARGSVATGAALAAIFCSCRSPGSEQRGAGSRRRAGRGGSRGVTGAGGDRCQGVRWPGRWCPRALLRRGQSGRLRVASACDPTLSPPSCTPAGAFPKRSSADKAAPGRRGPCSPLGLGGLGALGPAPCSAPPRGPQRPCPRGLRGRPPLAQHPRVVGTPFSTPAHRAGPAPQPTLAAGRGGSCRRGRNEGRTFLYSGFLFSSDRVGWVTSPGVPTALL